MRRRQFITLVGGAAAAWPLAARAQQPTMPVIGFLNTASPETFVYLVAAFRRGLNEAGFVEGQNVAIDYRWAAGHYDRMPALAVDLVEPQGERDCSVRALRPHWPPRLLRRSIPIVFTSGDDPVKLGLVASLNRPGGNVTGVSLFTVPLGAKRHELLHELVPTGTAIGVLVNQDSPNAEADIEDAEMAARVARLAGPHSDCGERARVRRSLRDARRAPHWGPGRRPTISFSTVAAITSSTLAAGYRLPTIYPLRDFTAAGGLMSYGPSISDAYRQAGVYVGRVLKGTRPADLPVVQPTKFEFVLNLKTAKELGLDRAG